VKFKSALVTQVSGSTGGATFAHNAGGLYVRARSIPTNPASAYQVAVRGILTGLSQAWSATLTSAQRLAWSVYAANVPLTDKLGDVRSVSGIAMFNRSNAARLQAGLSQVAAAPTTFNLGSFTAPVVTASHTSSIVSVAFTNTDSWATAAGGALIVYTSKPQSAGINYFKGPYRFAHTILGAGTAPTSPATFTSPFVLASGQSLFFKVVCVQADGRTSSPFRGSCTVS
jgi:hypothetical protein